MSLLFSDIADFQQRNPVVSYLTPIPRGISGGSLELQQIDTAFRYGA